MQKDEIKDITTSKELDAVISKYKLIIDSEIQKFKKDALKIKQNTFKKITSSQLSEFIQHNNKHLNIRNFNFIWKQHKFSKTFLNNITKLDYDCILNIVLPILFGNFTSCESPIVHEDNLTFFFSTKYNNALHVIIVIYFKRSLNACDYATQELKFVNVVQSGQYASLREMIISKTLNNNEKYPQVEYDKTGLIRAKELYYAHKKPLNSDASCYLHFPHEDMLIKNVNVLYTTKVKGKKTDFYSDAFEYKLNVVNETIFEKVESSDEDSIHSCLLDKLDKNNWEVVFSNQELSLITKKNPFMLSGQAGTGKTTVILMKIFLQYFNLQIQKSLFKNNEIDWMYIRENINYRCLSNQFRLVFTSYNQDLCDKTEKLFETMVSKSGFHVNYFSLQKQAVAKLASFKDIKSFPCFFNFRKLMFLIDSALTFQFFKRENFHKLLLSLHDCEITFIPTQEYYCNSYDTYGSSNEVTFFLRNPHYNNQTVVRKEVNETDFYEFMNKIINKAKEQKKRSNKSKQKEKITQNEGESLLMNKVISFLVSIDFNVNPLEVYSQIYSVIKGSITSSNSYRNCISREEYQLKGNKLTGFDSEYKDFIYDIAMLYENHKKLERCFDLQDLTNHLIRQVKIELVPHDIKLIDYLFIDEIQDLTINQIYLLVLVSRKVNVYTGDTGQTISEINRFRFQELKQLFYLFRKIVKDFPPVEQGVLSFNYRLNYNILRLSTFVKYLTRELFPNTLDFKEPDVALKISPFKPTLMTNLSALKTMILSSPDNNEFEKFMNNKMTFAFYSCWLFSKNETMERIRKEYSLTQDKCEIYAMTVTECKGLEYEIVIVYNFFSDSKFKGFWEKLLNNVTEDANNVENDLLDIKRQLECEDFSFIIRQIHEVYPEFFNEENTDKCGDGAKNALINRIIKNQKRLVKPKVDKKKLMFDEHEQFDFCTEIKRFYVMITRPRTFLLFYEEEDCSAIYNAFFKYELISKDTSSTIEKQIISYFKNAKLSIQNTQKMYHLAEEKFKEKDYKKAAFLFRQINYTNQAMEAEIYMKWEELKDLVVKGNQHEKVRMLIKSLLSDFNCLPDSYEDKDAIQGDCFLYSEEYDKALEVYKKYKKYDKCADIMHTKKKDYENAIPFYLLDHNYPMCFLLYEQIEKYEEMLEFTKKIKDEIGLVEFHNKYMLCISKILTKMFMKEKTEAKIPLVSDGSMNKCSFTMESFINDQNASDNEDDVPNICEIEIAKHKLQHNANFNDENECTISTTEKATKKCSFK